MEQAYVISPGRSLKLGHNLYSAGIIIRLGDHGIVEQDIKKWLDSGAIRNTIIDRTIRTPIVEEAKTTPARIGIIPPEDANPAEASQTNRPELPVRPVNSSYGKWPHDPSTLKNKDINVLNAMVMNIDPDVLPFATVEEARAQLSQDFMP